MHYYLIINEGLSNGLTKSQVVSPILYNSLQKEVGIISIERFGKKVEKIPNIKYKVVFFGIPYRLFLFNNLAFILVPVIAFFYALIISFFIKKNDILIARSYFPGIVLYYLKKIKGNNYKFDPRSLFIHESVTKRLLKKSSPLFKRWLKWENDILNNADMIIVVAQKQAEYYLEKTEKALKLQYIPCYASGSHIHCLNRRELLPFNNEDIVIAYYGSLDNGWNNKNAYYDIFLKAIEKGYKICIISQNHKDLTKDSRFLRSEIYIVNTQLNSNHNDFLQVCDYGIVVMPKVSDWETRLSVKFVEYLNNGLAVLVGEYVGEAVRLSNKYFKKNTILLSKNIGSLHLKHLSQTEKNEIKRKADELFSLRNFKKILD